MSGKYIVNIQILRFFAALSVVCAHIGITLTDLSARSGRSFDMVTLFDWGLGVDVFFVISGFIMYYLTHDRFGQKGVAADFLRRRLIRIVPLYWICTTLMLLSILVAGSVINGNILDAKHVIASYLFVPWLAPTAQPLPYPLLSLGWTLNYEMFFYFAFAVVLHWSRRMALRALAIFFALLIAASAAAPDSMWLLKFWGAPIIGEFLLGIWLADLHLSGRRLSLWSSIALVVAGLALATISFQLHAYDHLWRLLTGGVPAILIALGVVLAPSAGFKQPARALAIAGDASYALYLTHPFTVKAWVMLTMKLGAPVMFIYLFGIVAAILVSIAVHFSVEKPLGAWLSRLTSNKVTKTADS